MGDGHVFVSYSSADRGVAEDLVRQLESVGNRIWFAPRDVRPGKDYSEQIQSAIEQARAFVVIITNDSNESDFVRAETEMAFSRRRPIFPVRFAATAPAPGLALFLQLRHWTDVFGTGRQDAVARLGRELAAIGERGGRSRFVRSRHPAPQRVRSRAMIPLAAVGCAALLACGLLIAQGDDQRTPNATAVDAATGNVAGGAPPPPSIGQLDMGPLVATWLRYIHDTAPPPIIEENFIVDDPMAPANAATAIDDATTITNGANSVSGM